ncbi:hypothetical protein WMF21_21310 [Sorangium sp. So ce1099]
MHDPPRVRCRESLGDALPEHRGLAHAQPAAPQELGEVLSFEPLHGEERLAIRRAAVGDIADNGGVLEGGKHRRFGGEALRAPRVCHRHGGQDLDGDGAVVADVTSGVHHAHAALAAFVLQQEAAEPCAGAVLLIGERCGIGNAGRLAKGGIDRRSILFRRALGGMPRRSRG